MPGEFCDDARRQGIFGIGAADEVLHVEIKAGSMGQHVLAQQLEMFGRQRLVVVPPDPLCGLAVAHDELVLGGAPGVLAGQGAESTMGGFDRFAAAECRVVELGFRKIVMHRSGGPEPERLDAERRIANADFLHVRSSLRQLEYLRCAGT